MMMVDNISVNFSNVDMVKEYLASPIEMFIWVYGNKINLMEKVCMSMLMEKNIKENSKMVKSQEEDLTFIEVELDIKDNGRKIKKMDLEYSFIQIIKSMKEIG